MSITTRQFEEAVALREKGESWRNIRRFMRLNISSRALAARYKRRQQVTAEVLLHELRQHTREGGTLSEDVYQLAWGRG